MYCKLMPDDRILVSRTIFYVHHLYGKSLILLLAPFLEIIIRQPSWKNICSMNRTVKRKGRMGAACQSTNASSVKQSISCRRIQATSCSSLAIRSAQRLLPSLPLWPQPRHRFRRQSCASALPPPTWAGKTFERPFNNSKRMGSCATFAWPISAI